jgi:hypothetical protein
MIFAPLIAFAIAITALITGQSQQAANPPATQNKASADNPPVDILTYKIGPEYYVILDRPSSIAPSMAAENAVLEEMPNTPPLAGYGAPGGGPQCDARRWEGMIHSKRSSSEVRNDYGPDLFQLVIKNTSAKSIKAVEWDFLFPHCENDQFVPRYDVTTRTKIKPGGRKMLKSNMPVHDLCKMPENPGKQEVVSIKRIEYVDGSVWQKQ